MNNYDFLCLSTFEFENLSRDLLQTEFKILLECFTQGRDKGIDLRHAKGPDSICIVQCKRYKELPQLKQALNKEKEKIGKLNCSRYILTTSVALTPGNKKELFDLLHPHVIIESDIIGRDELNNILGRHPEVEKKHFKLWFSSVAVFEKIIHSAAANRASFSEAEIRKNINIYVQNQSFLESVKIIEDKKFVIVSGIPGIGKTTLAKMLIFHYLSEGYGLVDVSSDIDEAFQLYGENSKQIFYYDDFLGSNFLEDNLKKNEDKRLVQFIERISNSKNKILVMTTREYILQQAIQKYEVFNGSKLEISKCIVDVEKYTKFEKAKILYNHLFFAEVSSSHLAKLIESNNYLKIIEHKNYSPRIIQKMVSDAKNNLVEPNKLLPEFISNLDNPEKIWYSAFQNQIDRTEKFCLYVLALSNDRISEKDLFHSVNSRGVEAISYSAFKNFLKVLQNSFVEIEKGFDRRFWIKFQNPSIKDFVINQLKHEYGVLGSILSKTPFLEHITSVFLRFPSAHEYFNKHRICYNNDLYRIVETRLVSDLKGFTNLETNLKHKQSRLHNLHLIASFFDLEKDKSIRDLLVVEIREIDFKGIRFKEEIEQYIAVCESLSSYMEFNKDEIIKEFLLCSHDGKGYATALKLKEVFPENFESFIEKHGEEFYDIMDSVLRNERFNIDRGSQDDFDDMLDTVKEIQSILNTDRYEKIVDGLEQDKAEAASKEAEDRDQEFKDMLSQKKDWDSFTDEKQEIQTINNMFTSLLE